MVTLPGRRLLVPSGTSTASTAPISSVPGDTDWFNSSHTTKSNADSGREETRRFMGQCLRVAPGSGRVWGVPT